MVPVLHVIVPPEKHEAWLDRKVNDVDQVMELLQPIPNDAVKFHRVGTGVNSAKNQGEELVEEIDPNGSRLLV